MLDFLTVFVASMSVTFAENRLKQQQLWGYVVMSMFFPNAQLHAACFKIIFQMSSRALGNWLRGSKKMSIWKSKPSATIGSENDT